jgi:hypothetical protein
MSHMTPAWRIFLALETVAVLSSAISGLFQGALGPFLWAVGFILTLPGTLVLSPSVEHLLWGTHLGLRAISIASMLSAVAMNVMLFAAVTWAIGKVRRRGAI